MKKQNKKRISLKKEFIDSLIYIKESRSYIYLTITLFIISALIGFIFHSKFIFVEDLIKELLKMAQNLRGIDLIAFIFKNNLTASFYFLFLGIAFGISPFLNSITNGILIGYVSEKVISSTSIVYLWKLLPHGIFELPAIFISAGLGIKLGMITLSILSKKGREKFNENLRKSLLTFILIIIPLLIVAAIIEGLLITLLN
jgi:stage II sporulation protein M